MTSDFPVTASTQYGDLKGTVSIDGFNGPFLHELRTRAKVPAGFVPVGLSLYIGEPGPGSTHRSTTPLLDRPCHVSIYASNKPQGQGGDAIADYAGSHGSLPVSSFETDISLEEFFELIKRFKLVAKTKVLHDTELVSHDGD